MCSSASLCQGERLWLHGFVLLSKCWQSPPAEWCLGRWPSAGSPAELKEFLQHPLKPGQPHLWGYWTQKAASALVPSIASITRPHIILWKPHSDGLSTAFALLQVFWTEGKNTKVVPVCRPLGEKTSQPAVPRPTCHAVIHHALPALPDSAIAESLWQVEMLYFIQMSLLPTWLVWGSSQGGAALQLAYKLFS